MTLMDTAEFAPEGEAFDRQYTRLAATPILQRVAQLPDAARADCFELLDEYRRTDSVEDRRDILAALVEIVLDEPVKPIPIENVEREAKSTLAGAAASERLEGQAQAFGRNLKRFRGRKKMTQMQLGRAANMTQPQISYLERGQHRPQEGTVRKLAEVLGVSPEQLLPLE